MFAMIVASVKGVMTHREEEIPHFRSLTLVEII
jgi:hypothetical protein